MEYAEGGDFEHYITERQGISEIEARVLFKQIVLAIEECHSRGVIHRDLKLENVLFESKARNKIKIVDFGISGICKGSIGEKNEAGTLRYMAPEVLMGTDVRANPAIDIWAMGIMLYCMVYYNFPFNGSDHAEIKEKIATAEVKFPTTHFTTKEMKDLIQGLLQKDHAKRMNLSEIQQHDWMLLTDDEIEDQVEEAKAQYEANLLKKEEMLDKKMANSILQSLSHYSKVEEEKYSGSKGYLNVD